MLGMMRKRVRQPGDVSSAWLVAGALCLVLAALMALAAVFVYRRSGGWLLPSLAMLLAAVEAVVGLSALGRYLRFFRDVRERRGACLNCGHDLTDNVSGVCPECDTPVRPARDAPKGEA